MSLVNNVNNVAFATSFQFDKVVRIFTGTFNAATQVTARSYTLAGFPTSVNFYEVLHGLPRPVLCDLQWSLDGVTYYDNGVQDTSARGSIAFSDANYIYIYSPVASGTVYYRVYCTWIDNYDSNNPLVDTITYSNAPVQFDSRLNYQKIYAADSLTYAPGTFGSQVTQSVSHALGYTPNAKVWYEAFPNEVWPLTAGGASNLFYLDDSQDEAQLYIYTNQISVTLTRFSNLTKRAWYRIYYDQT